MYTDLLHITRIKGIWKQNKPETDQIQNNHVSRPDKQVSILRPWINICPLAQQNELHFVCHLFFVEEFLELGTLAYRPWCFSVPIVYGFHSEAYKAASGNVTLVRFWHLTSTSCNAVWILCSRAKSPMKNCNRRVNYCRMLTQILNFMNTHAEKNMYMLSQLRYFMVWVYYIDMLVSLLRCRFYKWQWVTYHKSWPGPFFCAVIRFFFWQESEDILLYTKTR